MHDIEDVPQATSIELVTELQCQVSLADPVCASLLKDSCEFKHSSCKVVLVRSSVTLHNSFKYRGPRSSGRCCKIDTCTEIISSNVTIASSCREQGPELDCMVCDP